ncbi:MAG: carbohydrate porin [Bacteroidales bacterium]|nr:carbohydrate porin [Bacteroidales bacterium]
MKKCLITGLTIIICVIVSQAQSDVEVSYITDTSVRPSFEANYITEFQTNFNTKHNKYNWVNLLSLSAELPTETIYNRWKNGSFQIELLSIYKLFQTPIVNDLMGYSSIEDENSPLIAFVLGYEHQWKKFSLFGGLRNLNRDYFSTPYESIFTNATAGMPPTLSTNFPIANFPISALGLHAEYQFTENWTFKSSLYNGVAYDPKKTKDENYNFFRSFRANPSRDGIFSMSELSYWQHKYGLGFYALGMSLKTKGNSGTSFYAVIEQCVVKNEKTEIELLLYAGYSPQKKQRLPEFHCTTFFAVGGYFAGFLSKEKRDKFGIYLSQGEFTGITERALEITWQYQIVKQVAIQPAFHIIRTGNETKNVGLFRFFVSV